MIDRYGVNIRVGWLEHHVLWLDAAVTLPRKERLQAYEQIADMTGRKYATVLRHANQRALELIEEAARQPRTPVIAARDIPHQRPAPSPLEPFRWPSKRDLTGARAPRGAQFAMLEP